MSTITTLTTEVRALRWAVRHATDPQLAAEMRAKLASAEQELAAAGRACAMCGGQMSGGNCWTCDRPH